MNNNNNSNNNNNNNENKIINVLALFPKNSISDLQMFIKPTLHIKSIFIQLIYIYNINYIWFEIMERTTPSLGVQSN